MTVIIEPESDHDVDLSDEVVAASYERVKWVADNHTYRLFTWENDDPSWEPLLLDAFTASMLVKIHDAINSDNQAKMDRLIAKSRNSFGRVVEIGWSLVQ